MALGWEELFPQKDNLHWFNFWHALFSRFVMIYTITICSKALSEGLNKDMSKQEWERQILLSACHLWGAEITYRHENMS